MLIYVSIKEGYDRKSLGITVLDDVCGDDDDGVTCRAKVPSTTLQKMGFL